MKIAVCEADTLMPTRDAGSRAVTDLVTGLRGLGHETQVFIEAAGDLPAQIARFAPDLIVISRPGLFARLLPGLRALEVPLVYFAHDLHFVRIGLQQEFSRRSDARVESVMRIVERLCFEAADLTILPTEPEAQRVRDEFPGARAVAINYWSMPVLEARTSPPSNRRIMFVGSSAHAPNADGMAWFAREVWPTLRIRHPASEVTVVGVWRPDDPLFETPGIHRAGEVSDPELDELFSTSWLGIAPMRFGAGMKRKTLHYLSAGLPVVGTSFAIEGLTDAGSSAIPGMMRATTPDEWIDTIDTLDDASRWIELSAAGVAFVARSFSESRYRDGLEHFLSVLGYRYGSWNPTAG